MTKQQAGGPVDGAQLVAGIIGTPRGLQGEVSVIVRTDWPEERFQPGVDLDTNSTSHPVLTITEVKSHRDRLYLRFAQVNSREQAEELKHVELLVDPLEEEDAWYVEQLVGLDVVDPDGRVLGVVTGLQVGLAQDLLEVLAGGQTVLVPLVQEIVPEVDLESGRVRVTPPAGLFDVEETR